MHVLVVGAGAMGRWVARSAVSADDEVFFADVDPAAAREAAGAVDARVDEATRLDEPPAEGPTVDLVVVAVPLPAATTAIETYAGRARRAICDVTGSMTAPLASMREAAPDLERMSLHPLFAPERGTGTVAVVQDAPGPLTTGIRDRLADAGNDVFETTAAEHDEAMETVQAMAHTAVVAFGLAAADVPEEFHTPVSAALSDLVDQVAGGEPRVYADIQAAFEGADDVADAARRVAEADPAEFRDLYEELS